MESSTIKRFKRNTYTDIVNSTKEKQKHQDLKDILEKGSKGDSSSGTLKSDTNLLLYTSKEVKKPGNCKVPLKNEVDGQVKTVSETAEIIHQGENIGNDEADLPSAEKYEPRFDCTASPLRVSGIENYNRDPADALENDCSSLSDVKMGDTSDEQPGDVDTIHHIQKQTEAFCDQLDESFKEVLHCREKTSVKLDEKVPDYSAEACDFCKGTAQFMCEYCTFFYCKTCLEKVHPALGPYLSHKVIPLDGEVRVEHHKRCREHGLIAQLFCSYCEKNRCTECVKTRCSLHFKGRVSDADIEREKTILVEELEKATTRLGFLERYKEEIKQEIDNIQMTGLMRREQIRQEFVSFQDLLIQKEAMMLEQLDQEVNERVNHVTDTLQASVKSLEMEDASLTTTVTELVQSPNDARFIEEYVKAKDLCHQLNDKVREFDRDWARNTVNTPCPVLDNHFTMLLEKKQLSEKLDGAMSLPKLCFKQTTLFMDLELLKISEYIETPLVPPSTDVIYHMQLLQAGKLVYELRTRDLQEMELNSLTAFQLVLGKSYLLRITPVYRCLQGSVGSLDTISKQGSPCHMFLVVRGPKVRDVTLKSKGRRGVRLKR